MTDGTSQTPLRASASRGQGTPEIKNDMYSMNNALTANQIMRNYKIFDMIMAMPLTNWMGVTWAIGDMHDLQPHLQKKRTPGLVAGMDSSMMMGGSMANMAAQLPPSSYRPGGINVLVGDGWCDSSRRAALIVWRALSTRNGGEIVSGSDY